MRETCDSNLNYQGKCYTLRIQQQTIVQLSETNTNTDHTENEETYIVLVSHQSQQRSQNSLFPYSITESIICVEWEWCLTTNYSQQYHHGRRANACVDNLVVRNCFTPQEWRWFIQQTAFICANLSLSLSQNESLQSTININEDNSLQWHKHISIFCTASLIYPW